MYLQKVDSKIYNFIKKEIQRQENTLEMIPSENFVSIAVLQALGSVLTNKYAEGYYKKRYYGGCEYIDEIEKIAIERAKKLFSAEHVNVQPLSGAPANLAVYFGLLNPGDTILGMDLSHGGHLTHGHPVTFAAKIFNFIGYKTDKQTGLIDYDNLRQLALEYKPKLILVGYSSYTRLIDYHKIKQIAEEVNALTMADISHFAGLIAGKQMENPVPLFDVVTTTTHKTLRGPRGGMILCKEFLKQKIDKAVFPGLQGGPHENNIAAKAVAFYEALQKEFINYAQQVIKNAKILCEELKKKNFVIVFNTTENHMILIDMIKSRGVSGLQAQKALELAGINVNKNVVPDDERSPLDPSGIRLGTPAITTRGMKENEMKIIAEFIAQALENYNKPDKLKKISKSVKDLCSKFVIYKDLENLWK